MGSAGVSSPPAVTGAPPVRLPAQARRLQLALHDAARGRMRERCGFDINAPDASDRAEALLAAQPDGLDALLAVAAVRSSRGEGAAAAEAARRAVEVSPTSARAAATLAAVLAQAGDRAGAAAEAGRAVELDPNDPTARFNRGVAALAAGDHRSARSDFEEAEKQLGLPPLPWWRRWTG